MGTYLDDILAAHRRTAAADDRSTSDLTRQAGAAEPVRGFTAAIRTDRGTAPGPAVIAEVKRRSPSKGPLAADLDPATLAAQYRVGGASAISVLTDGEFFGGSAADLVAARDAGLPILRKDFTVSVHDVLDARIMGADCVLLIAAALDDRELSEFHRAAVDVGLDVLVEIHDEAELDRAMAVGATLIGVNQRDLVTFEVDHDRAVRMAARFVGGVVSVAESGVRGPDDAASLARAGFDAVLVGETLVTAGDPVAAVAGLRSAVL